MRDQHDSGPRYVEDVLHDTNDEKHSLIENDDPFVDEPYPADDERDYRPTAKADQLGREQKTNDPRVEKTPRTPEKKKGAEQEPRAKYQAFVESVGKDKGEGGGPQAGLGSGSDEKSVRLF